MKNFMLCMVFNVVGLCCNAQFTVNALSSHPATLTCKQTSVVMIASSNHSVTPVFTWKSVGGLLLNGISYTVNAAGVYTLTGSDGTLTATHLFTVSSNTVAPVSSAPPTFTVSSGTIYTFAVISPTTQVVHYVYEPNGNVHTVGSSTTAYTAGPAGTYTHCIEDMINGCTSCGTMVVCSMCGAPGSVTTSIPRGEQSFSEVRISVDEGSVQFSSPSACAISILNTNGAVAGKVLLLPHQPHLMRLPPGVYIVRENCSRRRPYKLLVP